MSVYHMEGENLLNTCGLVIEEVGVGEDVLSKYLKRGGGLTAKSFLRSSHTGPCSSK